MSGAIFHIIQQETSHDIWQKKCYLSMGDKHFVTWESVNQVYYTITMKRDNVDN